jgi:hypothetical protein
VPWAQFQGTEVLFTEDGLDISIKRDNSMKTKDLNDLLSTEAKDYGFEMQKHSTKEREGEIMRRLTITSKSKQYLHMMNKRTFAVVRERTIPPGVDYLKRDLVIVSTKKLPEHWSLYQKPNGDWQVSQCAISFKVEVIEH